LFIYINNRQIGGNLIFGIMATIRRTSPINHLISGRNPGRDPVGADLSGAKPSIGGPVPAAARKRSVAWKRHARLTVPAHHRQLTAQVGGMYGPEA
jgi:hypothetical protein